MSAKKKPEPQSRIVRARASFVPASVDTEARTVDLVWTTGAPVLRYDWARGKLYYERLRVDDQSIDLGRLNRGAPFLNSHSSYDLGDVIGVVERAWVEDGQGKAVVRFSSRPEVEPIWRDVVDGILRNISVGYDPIRAEDVDEMIDGIGVREVTWWEPLELSLVPIPADAEAQVRALARGESQPAHRAEEKPMDPEETEARETEDTTETEGRAEEETTDTEDTTEDPPPADEERARRRAVEQERARGLAIRKVARQAKLPDSWADDMIARGVSVAKVREKALAAIAASDGPEIRSPVTAGANEHHTARRARAVEGLLHRANVVRTDNHDARAYATMSLLRLAEDCLSHRGVSTAHLSPARLAQRAMSESSDFSSIIAEFATRTLRNGYEQYPRTFVDVFRRATDVLNFKSVERVKLSDVPELGLVAEGGVYPQGSFSDSKEAWAIAKYGEILSITWETIINDDLDAMSRVPRMLGNAGARKESDIVWGILTGSGTLADGVAIFHSTKGNLTDAVLDAAGLEGARKYFRTRTGSTGDKLNLTMTALVVGPELESDAEKLLRENTLLGLDRDKILAPSLRSLNLVVEPRITGTNWYAAASPNEVDTLEYGYLAGEEGITMEETKSHDVDDIRLRARLVFGAGCIDRVGLYKSTGDAA